MTMSRKDFQVIASEIRLAYACEYGDKEALRILTELAQGLSKRFCAINSKFDERKFMEMCFDFGQEIL